MWLQSARSNLFQEPDPVAPFQHNALGSSGLRDCGGAIPCRYYYHVPAAMAADSPVLVSVHGISLNAAEHLVRMRRESERAGALLIAPWFDRTHYRGYQRLLCRDGRTRADLALLAMITDATAKFGGDGERIHLSGFSGGGQFAHRFAAVHGERVAACVTTAAGWYTFPDADQAWPQGLAAGTMPPGIALHPTARQVPIHVLIGSRDSRPEPSLNAAPAIVAQQGVSRLDRARAWVAAMRADRARHGGAEITLTVIDQLDHDFSKAVERHALDALVVARLGLQQTKETDCA